MTNFHVQIVDFEQIKGKIELGLGSSKVFKLSFSFTECLKMAR